VAELNDMNSEFERHEITLADLSDDLMRLNSDMEGYLKTITTRAEYYRTCQS